MKWFRSTCPYEEKALRACLYHLPRYGAVNIRIRREHLLAASPQIIDLFRINLARSGQPAATSAHVSRPVGIAVDIGTTTVAALAAELHTGEQLARAAAFNAQMPYGDDVLSRIHRCRNDSANVKLLQQAINKQTIQVLIESLCRQADIEMGRITCLCLSGNTTMLHLATGADPAPMGVVPFTPVFLDARRYDDADIFGFDLPAGIRVQLLPSASAYIGADIVAGLVVSGLIDDDGPSLLIDIGTNGEILLKTGTRLIGCATAAGPAFEGTGLTSGIRAVQGAIEHLQLSSDGTDLACQVIGGGKPIGLCGTAYIDFIGGAARAGLIGPAGRFSPLMEQCMPERILDVNGGKAIHIACTGTDKRIVITEVDIAHLLQAKAALAAGIRILLHQTDCQPADIRKVYLAGGFGMKLNAVNAIACGLLPGFCEDQIELIGNTSLAGAYLAMMDSDLIDIMAESAKRIEVIELNQDPGFEEVYINELMLP